MAYRLDDMVEEPPQTLTRPGFSRQRDIQRDLSRRNTRRLTWLEPLDNVFTNSPIWDNPFQRIYHAQADDTMLEPILSKRYSASEASWKVQDVENPQNWPTWYRNIVLGCTSFSTLVVVMASTAYASSIPSVMAEFDITDRTIPVLGITTFLFGLALGPFFFAPMSEMFGRRPVYTVAMSTFVILLLPSALARNLATLIATRFLAGLAGSVMVSNAPGTLNDIATNETRALYFSVWTLGVGNGPVLGPVFAGIIDQYLGWRWIHWILIILASISCAMMASLKETYSPVLLAKRNLKLNRHGVNDGPKHVKFSDRLEKSLKRPIVMTFTEPICLFWDIYIAILYAILYLCVVGYPIVFQQLRGWSPAVSGLPFLSIGFGIFLCILAEPYLRRLIKAINFYNNARNSEEEGKETIKTSPESTSPLIILGGVLIPIGQLLFALSASPPNTAVLPIISGIPFGMGNTLVLVYVTDYLASCYGEHAASALVGNAAFRNLVGGVLPLLAPFMYLRLGPLTSGMILMACEIILISVPLVFWRYGSALRARSRLAKVT